MATLAALAACRTAQQAEGSPPPAQAPSCPPGAEALLGVDFTDAEWEQLSSSLDEQLSVAKELRGHSFENGLAPATVFDPTVPGLKLPSAAQSSWSPGSATPPDDDEAIAFAPLSDLSRWLTEGSMTSLRLTQIALDRIRRFDPGLRAVITPMDETALAQARRADEEIQAGRRRSALHGIPWGAKDLIDTAGVPTTWGAAPFRDRVPTRDATVVNRLAQAGAVLVAKLSSGALAYGDIWFGGVTRNPWNLREGASGSSAGPAAAVAAGLVGFALGTETLGSIVSPCLRCGATGLRPTFGRVPRTGSMALSWSLDKLGPIARRAEDTALVLQALVGPDGADPAARDVALVHRAEPLAGARIGFYEAHFDSANEVERAALAAARRVGAKLVPLPPLPELPYTSLLLVLYAEAAASFQSLTLADRDDDLVWQAPEAWPNLFRRAHFISAVDFVRAQQVRREIMLAVHTAWAGVDVVLAPPYAGQLLTISNGTGHPSIVLPAGFLRRAPQTAQPWPDAVPRPTPEGEAEVPHGITLIGQLYREDTLTQVATALERELAVATRRPPLW